MKKIIIFLVLVLAGNYFFLKSKLSSNKNKKSFTQIISNSTSVKDKSNLSNIKDPINNISKKSKSHITNDDFYKVASKSFSLLVSENLNLRNKIEEMERSHIEYKENTQKSHKGKLIRIDSFKNDMSCITGPTYRSCSISNGRLIMINGFSDTRGSKKSRIEIVDFLKGEIEIIQDNMQQDLDFIAQKIKEIKKIKKGQIEFNKNYKDWKNDLKAFKEDKRAIVDLHVEWVETGMEIASDSSLAIELIKRTCSLEPGLYGCDSKTTLSDEQIWQFVELN